MNVTPRIFGDVERSMSGRGRGRGICRDFRLGSVNMISVLSGLGSIEREIVLIRPIFNVFNFGISGSNVAGRYD